jgi:hypothetical protein
LNPSDVGELWLLFLVRFHCGMFTPY